MSSRNRKNIFPALIFIMLFISAIAFLPAVIAGDNAPQDIQPPVSAGDVSSSDFTEPQLPPEPEKPDAATLMFGGDILIHKSVYNQANTGGNSYNFKPYVEYFKDVFVADYNAVNLECPVDAYGDNKNISTYPQFNAPLELLDAIKDMNVDLCSNSNNHMIDQGHEGLLKTLENVRSHGFDTLGTYASPEEHDALFIKELGGIKVGFVAYSQYTNGLKLNKELESYSFDRMGLKAATVNDILPKVNELKNAGAEIIVAILHWGIEYNDYPGTAQESIAHGLCEGGVDVIIGSHPHVVQPIEKITVTAEDGTQRDCLIVYSLGNLMCNQSTKGEVTQQGMVVGIRLERGEDGIARLDDAFYMPTLLYVTWEEGSEFMRLIPAARYMDGGEIPEYFNRSGFTARSKDTWNRVRKVVGDDITAVKFPDEYPEGFFEIETE